MEKPSLLWLSLMNDTAQKTEEILNRILHFFLFIFFFGVRKRHCKWFEYLIDDDIDNSLPWKKLLFLLIIENTPVDRT